MSEIIGTEIHLGSSTWVRDFSLYLIFKEGTSHKDYLYELQTDDIMARVQERAKTDAVWNVFVSYGRVTGSNKERKRTLKWKDLTWVDAIAKIKEDVVRKRPRYQPMGAPEWWVPLPKAELEQIGVMLAKSARTTSGMEKLEAAYDDDNYVAELKLDGHRAKAHFFSNSVQAGQIRFDSRDTSKDTGHFVENTGCLFFLSSLWHKTAKNFVHEWHGTVVDGEVTHPGGLYSVQSIMGSSPGKALEFQKANGCATYTIFDVIRIKGKDVTGYPWKQRRKWLEQLHAKWVEAIHDVRRSKFLKLTEVYYGSDDKRSLRQWVFANGQEGTILKNKESHYILSGRGWEWIKDKEMIRVSCVVIGYDDSTSASYGPKGWVKNLKLGQYKDGELIEVGTTSGMSEQIRQYISENKERCMGEVVDIQCQEQLKSHALRHPQFVCFRKDVKPEACTVDQEA